MTKARDLANLISTGNPLADGALAASEVSGLHAVATSGAYANLTGTPTLATVATSGAYANLTGTPSLATVATSGAYSDLSGSPSGDSLLPSQSGNTGKFLTSNGSAASWADAGGGSYELILKQTISSAVGGLNFSNPSAPQGQLLLIIDGITSSNSYDQISILYKDSSGNNLSGNSAYSVAAHHWGVGGTHGNSQDNQDRIQLNKGNNTTGSKPMFGHINIYGWGTTTPHLRGMIVYTDNNGPYLRGVSLVSKYEDGSNVPNRINISADNGNLTAGDVYLYKLL